MSLLAKKIYPVNCSQIDGHVFLRFDEETGKLLGIRCLYLQKSGLCDNKSAKCEQIKLKFLEFE